MCTLVLVWCKWLTCVCTRVSVGKPSYEDLEQQIATHIVTRKYPHQKLSSTEAPPAKTDQDIIQDLSQDLMKSQQRVAAQAAENAKLKQQNTKLKQLVLRLQAQVRGQGGPVTGFQVEAAFNKPFTTLCKRVEGRIASLEAKIDAQGSEPAHIQARMLLKEPRKVKQCWEDNVYSIQHEDFDYTTVYPAESTASHNITGDGTFSTCVQMPDGTSVEHTTTAPMEGFAIREPTT